LQVTIEKDSDGYYAFCPSLQGCFSQGDTYAEVLVTIRDAVRFHVEDCVARGEHIIASDRSID
jgi:predicted RNase H-like HicB family nuclease